MDRSIAERSVRQHLADVIQRLPPFSSVLPLLTDVLLPFARYNYCEAERALLAARAEAQKQGLCAQNSSLFPGTTPVSTPLARSIDTAIAALRALARLESEADVGERLTPQELELVLSRMRGAVILCDSVFVEHTCRGWYVGREGVICYKPEALDKNGNWCGSDDRYFPTLIDALRHAKRWGYLV